MKSMMRVWVVLIVASALVPSSEAGIFSRSGETPAVSVQGPNTPDKDVRGEDSPGNFPTGSPYPCIPPAYPDYIDAGAVPCPIGGTHTPDPMGSWGF